MTPSLEYIAGFFDGEGSIGIYHDGTKRPHLRTQLSQNITAASESLFTSLQQKWGGNLSRDHNTKNTCFNWQLNSDTAACFLSEISPHLVLKKAQADIALAWFYGRPPAGRNERGHPLDRRQPIDLEVMETMKRLKRNEVTEAEMLLLLARLCWKQQGV